ncbi:MAG: hypothetical protein H0W94_01815 [Actinobacteria bacterium]|nr:hypothetical protein [Actinomycetota bacterium]
MLDAVALDDGVVVARYAWSRTAPTQAGEMRITTNGDRISRLVVTFDPPLNAEAGPILS